MTGRVYPYRIDPERKKGKRATGSIPVVSGESDQAEEGREKLEDRACSLRGERT
jgi:hypothetical protein